MTTTYKPLYIASASLLFTGANSLASDANRLAGAQSDQYDNTSNLYDDVLLSGTVKTGTSPTLNKQIDIWVFACKDGSSTYIDTITNGGTAGKTLTSAEIRNAGGKLLKTIIINATSNVLYEFSNESIAALFGGSLPQKFVIFVAQDTGAALNATGNVLNTLGIQYQGV